MPEPRNYLSYAGGADTFRSSPSLVCARLMRAKRFRALSLSRCSWRDIIGEKVILMQPVKDSSADSQTLRPGQYISQAAWQTTDSRHGGGGY
jgi:hypothetical protein